ncbi:hypothetical protein B0A52_06687 [Exophiala mesophila]|uniref:Zn(2)-C6 fungal-type domain-containing protein n=1 Tax=Exophiala mesophila TaxID=212818 RepID=A0A438N230_EXOME|nr:hypothetical protein B0A52_06687 [Exophiala mesophila]
MDLDSLNQTKHLTPSSPTDNKYQPPSSPTQSRAPSATTMPDGAPPSTSTSTTAMTSNPTDTLTSTVTSPSAPGPRLNPRSCITCRRRKVRCNKANPCANCDRAGIECIFPGPGRAPRKPRKPPDAELLARLRKLEGVVHSLGAQVDADGPAINTSVKWDRNTSGSPLSGQVGTGADTRPHQIDSPLSDRSATATGDGGKRSSLGEKQLGRLVVSDDRSRYVTNAFWTAMSDEIAEMRDLLDGSDTEDEDETIVPESERHSQSSHQAFIFGYSSTMVDLRSLHPTPSQTFILWEIFKENVDPVVRVLHRPTARTILMNAVSNLDRLSKQAEALLFSMYLGAVVSCTPKQCQELLDDDQQSLIKRYRFATEQALARADLLNSNSLMCMQAFCLFLVFVRHCDDSRVVWSLVGLAIHLAQALGIHRDGPKFGLNPFDTEMRRRLWWQLTLLDNRSAEDQGTDPTFMEQCHDTKIPLNIDDEDIWPGMQDPPQEHMTATEMTFCLVRYELNSLSRRLNYSRPGYGHVRGMPEMSLDDQKRLIDETQQRLEDRYLRHCNLDRPIHWVTVTVTRLILAKLRLMVDHFHTSGIDSPQNTLPEIREQVFVTSVEMIESIHTLESTAHTARWSWLFRTHMQWQSVAFVLSELCVQPQGPHVERAWKAIESVYYEELGKATHQKGMLWKPLRHLMSRAKMMRAKQQPLPEPGSQDASGQDMIFTHISSSTPMQHFMRQYPNNILSSAMEAFDMDLDEAGPPSNPAPVSKTSSSVRRPYIEGSSVTPGTSVDDSLASLDPTSLNEIYPRDKMVTSNINLAPSSAMFDFGWTPTLVDGVDVREPYQRYLMNAAEEWF